MDAVKRPIIAAVSGVKNSGKTTFLQKLVKELTNRGYKTAVIKHDGHDFEPDVPDTDTWKLRKAGAYGTAIFSNNQWMITKKEPNADEVQLMKHFPEADFILLEGFKYSDYPKFELVRKGNSEELVCDPKTLLAVVTDLDFYLDGILKIGLEEIEVAADMLEKLVEINS